MIINYFKTILFLFTLDLMLLNISIIVFLLLLFPSFNLSINF